MRTHTPLRFTLTGHFSLLAAALVVTHAGCDATLRTATREAKPLAYVGQVQLGEPTNEDGHVLVPLKYLGGEWGQNSAIVPTDVKSTVKGMEIEMTVITSVATGTDANQGYRLALPEDSKGDYTVYYRDPDGTRHEIGALKITE